VDLVLGTASCYLPILAAIPAFTISKQPSLLWTQASYTQLRFRWYLDDLVLPRDSTWSFFFNLRQQLPKHSSVAWCMPPTWLSRPIFKCSSARSFHPVVSAMGAFTAHRQRAHRRSSLGCSCSSYPVQGPSCNLVA
jgi:hypothetical protein